VNGSIVVDRSRRSSRARCDSDEAFHASTISKQLVDGLGADLVEAWERSVAFHPDEMKRGAENQQPFQQVP